MSRRYRISTDVELVLKKYLGISVYGPISVLFCRNCNTVLGQVNQRDQEGSWFNPSRTCQCGCIPDYDPLVGELFGPEKARLIIEQVSLSGMKKIDTGG